MTQHQISDKQKKKNNVICQHFQQGCHKYDKKGSSSMLNTASIQPRVKIMQKTSNNNEKQMQINNKEHHSDKLQWQLTMELQMVSRVLLHAQTHPYGHTSYQKKKMMTTYHKCTPDLPTIPKPELPYSPSLRNAYWP